jgi:hypothetical protein
LAEIDDPDEVTCAVCEAHEEQRTDQRAAAIDGAMLQHLADINKTLYAILNIIDER